jgi:hypothetical protein
VKEEEKGGEDDLVHTESEDIGMQDDEDEEERDLNDESLDPQEKIQRKIKQLLGLSYKEIKTELGDSRSDHGSVSGSGSKSGRGKWHYASDTRYGFNVSYSNGDTIISMG